jgi:DNA-binding LytR/AlgR family response regulator
MVKISSDEAFSILHKWQVELTPIVFVGSLMPSNPLRGLVAVTTREGVWNSGDKPASIWGFLLTGKGTSFLASKFEAFEYLQPAEVPSDIKMSLPKLAPEHAVLALTQIQTLVNTSARAEEDHLASVEEILFLVEDDATIP